MPNSLVKNVLPIIFISGFVRTNGLMNLSSETLLPHYHLGIDYGLDAYGSHWSTFSNDRLLVKVINYPPLILGPNISIPDRETLG